MAGLQHDIAGAATESTGQSGRKTMPIPVIVLNWNGVDDTIECVDALLAGEGVDYRVVLVDNGSSGDDFDRLQARYASKERVALQRNPDNLGFARGVNAVLGDLLASPESRPEFIALLNNDAVPEPDWLAALLKMAESSEAAAVSSKMLRYDDRNKLDNAGHVFLNTGEVLPRGAGRSPAEFDAPAEVAGVCAGACLLRTDMLADIGIFDEFFVTGYEDAELGLRAMLGGYRQIYAPKAVVRHRIGASIDKIRDRDYAVQLQVNINYTYLKLMPGPVIAWNAPWIVVKTAAALVVPLVAGRWRLLGVQAAALAETARIFDRILESRRNRPLRRISSRVVIARQNFFARQYWTYFRRFVLGRQKTIFER